MQINIEGKERVFKKGAQKCWLLLIMSVASFAILLLLNLYIGNEVVQYLLGDGWSFLGGLFIAMSFVVTIPLLIFSFSSIRKVRNNSKNKYIFPVILGVVGILIGIVLQNATELCIYIIAYSILLLVSCFTCKYRQ